MNKKTVGRLAWASFYLSFLPVAVYLGGFAGMYYDPAPVYVGAIYLDVIMDIVGCLAIVPFLLAALALLNGCEKKWPAVSALVVNTLLLAMVAEIYFSRC